MHISTTTSHLVQPEGWTNCDTDNADKPYIHTRERCWMTFSALHLDLAGIGPPRVLYEAREAVVHSYDHL